MKIVYVITKLELGGAQKVVLTLAEHFNKTHEVYLIAGPGGLLNNEAKRILGDRFIINPYLKREISPFYDFKAYKFLTNFFRKEKPDIVHTHSSKAGILGRLAAYNYGVNKIFHTIHGFPFNDFRQPLVNDLYKNLERYAAKKCNKLIAVTKMDIERGLRNDIGDLSKYVLIRAAADLDYFENYKYDSLKLKKELNIDENKFVVTQVSCFKKQKNPIGFLKVALNLKEKYGDKFFFILVGDGILRDKIEDFIKKHMLEDSVLLTGWQKDIRPYLAIADVFTLTSLWEGLPIAIIEAFAMKKPVVVTAIDGNQEVVIDGKNGFLVSPKNYEKMAERIFYLYKNDELGKKMGHNGYEKVKKEFSISKMISDTEKLYCISDEY